MRHPTENSLRRLVDEPAGVSGDDHAHVAGCSTCAATVEDAARDANAIGALLGAPASRHAVVDVDVDLEQLRVREFLGGIVRRDHPRRLVVVLDVVRVEPLGIVDRAVDVRDRHNRRAALVQDLSTRSCDA